MFSVQPVPALLLYPGGQTHWIWSVPFGTQTELMPQFPGILHSSCTNCHTTFQRPEVESKLYNLRLPVSCKPKSATSLQAFIKKIKVEEQCSCQYR